MGHLDAIVGAVVVVALTNVARNQCWADDCSIVSITAAIIGISIKMVKSDIVGHVNGCRGPIVRVRHRIDIAEARPGLPGVYLCDL